MSCVMGAQTQENLGVWSGVEAAHHHHSPPKKGEFRKTGDVKGKEGGPWCLCWSMVELNEY